MPNKHIGKRERGIQLHNTKKRLVFKKAGSISKIEIIV
jgi:hypothetical protein